MKLLKQFTLLIILLIAQVVGAQELEKKHLTSSRIETPPKMDGLLDDEVWQNAEIASDFIQHEPNPGDASTQKTEVKVLYSNSAIYVGAHMYDTAPDSILSQFVQRDNIGNSDWFGVMLSCFQDGINAFEFIVTPDGVQFDAQVSAYGEDDNWNAVWQCNTKIVDNGWIAEFKIPYSAIRFPKDDVQTWDVNFIRDLRRHREKTMWQYVDPEIDGWVNQSGEMNGIENIEPPIRLFFYPYASAYLEVQKDENGDLINGTSYNGGLDIKYGINNAFTLDMTLIPDFGQVQSDAQILNLSPFETRFGENRQFFTEGTELFRKGGLFYSRRIGGSPLNDYLVDDALDADTNLVVDERPMAVQLMNATKISGRNKHGLGIGFFNAITKPTKARLKGVDSDTGEEYVKDIETSPLTNYNIIVLDQNLKNNSYISLINTNVTRDGSEYDANVIGSEFSVKNKKNSWELSGGANYSKKFNTGDDDTDDGYTYEIGIDKISGQFNFGVGHGVESKHYDPNDLGILFGANSLETYGWMGYNIYKPFWKFNRMWSNINIWHEKLFEPRVYTDFGMAGNVGLNTRKFHTFSFNMNYMPLGGHDYFESRVDGRYFYRPKLVYLGGWYSSDYRKKLAIDIGVWQNIFIDSDWTAYNWRIAPRYRVNDKLMLTYVYSRQNVYNQRGWAETISDDEIIFGSRDVITHTNVLSADYIFTNRMGLTFKLRHYWSFVDYNEFLELGDEGDLLASDYEGFNEDGTSDHDGSFNAFTIDMVYKWVFAPGSELSLVWKNAIFDYDEKLPNTFTDNFNRTVDLPQTNSFSIKVLYFIDYLSLRSKGQVVQN